MGRKPDWVKENIEWFSNMLELSKDSQPKVWPIVQAYNDPHVIDAAEFKQVMQNGLVGASTGIMMFTTYAVAEDSSKVEVLKEMYLN